MPHSRLVNCVVISLAAGCSLFAANPVNVLSNRYNMRGTSANLNESLLNVSNVNSAQFGLLFTLPVNGSIYAQPLYVSGVTIPGRGVHNVIYVATMQDMLYAFDADSNTGPNAAPLWTLNLTNPPNVVPPTWEQATGGSGEAGNVSGTVGILSTPVIDLSTNRMYLVARTVENGTFVYRLHKVNIATGAEVTSVVISGSVRGSGAASVWGIVSFDPKQQLQRPGLVIAGGLVIVAFGSQEDLGLYHGWVMAFREDNLKRVAVFCTTPDGSGGGIWQAGRTPVVDGNNNVYFLAGNGDWDGITNFGQSALKFSTAGGRLSFVDWFAADDVLALDLNDADVGSSGLMLLPNTNLLFGGGKQGVYYLLDSTNLGQEESGNGQIPQILETFAGQIKGGPVYWQSPDLGRLVYTWDRNSVLQVYHFNGVTFDNTPVMTGTTMAVNPGAILSLSGRPGVASSAILWASLPISDNADHTVVPGIVRAFNAETLTEIWNSQQSAARDSVGTFAKYVPPMVANGKLYMATFNNVLMVYGLLPTSPAAVQ